LTVALYCRVSTDEQAEHGFSIDDQKERLAAYCASQGWTDYEFYIDDGYSGTTTDRPELNRLIRHVRAGRIKTVVVYKLDRLSRRQKDALYLLEDVFEANGVAFKSATEPFDTSTPLGKAMLGILAVFAQLERDTIMERTRAGKRQRTRKGLWYGGVVPYGYQYSPETQELTVVPEQAALVREIFQRVLKGESYLSIGKWAAKRAKDRAFYAHKTLIYILSNPIYTGKLNQGGVLVDGLHEAIIDYDTWKAVQEEMARRHNGRRPYGKYLLSNLLECGVCHDTMKHTIYEDRRYSKPKVRGYYICSSKHKRANACPSRYYPDTELEARVVEYLKQLYLEPEMLQQAWAERKESDQSHAETIEKLQAQLDDIEEQLDRWYDAYGTGKLDINRVQQRINALEEERKAILLRLDELEVEQPENREVLVLNALEMMNRYWDNATDDERAQILRTAVKKITVYPDGRLDPEWNR
jgi:site-specific DNA recombinase